MGFFGDLFGRGDKPRDTSRPGRDDWFQSQGPPAPTAPANAPPVQPGAGDASQQDPVDYFNSLIGNLPPNSASLVSLEPQLQARGIKILRNAEGIAGKIQLPSGEIVDVGQSFSSGNPSAMHWQTLRNDPKFHPEAAGPPGGGQGPYGMLSGGTGSLAGIAAAALETSPGFQFRLGEGQKALERSAASKGTLLTGGTLKGLTRYAQDFASNEYANNYARLFGEQNARYQQLYGLSGLGLNAAGQQAGAGTSYGGQLGNLYAGQAGAGTDLITGGANAGAAGTIGAGNAWQQGLGGAANAAQQAYLMWLMSGRGGGGGGQLTLPPK
jgi:hypothetical protein